MSYVERTMAWFLKNRVIRGFTILLDSKFIFYSLITLVWAILTPVSLGLYNFLGASFVWGILKMEIAIIFSFFIIGIINNFLSSVKTRILVSIVILAVISVLIFFIIPLEVQFYFPVIGSIVFAGVLGLALFIIIRAFNTSWVSRMMMVGKSPKKMFMHNIAIFINALSILAPIFLVVRYFQNYQIFDLILALLGFLVWGVVIYATTHFPNYFAYDIFASILSATYFIVIILYFMYIATSILIVILDIIFLLFGISTLVQVLHSRRKVEKVSVYVPKSAPSPEDSSIIIIHEDETEETPTSLPKDTDEYSLEEETTEIRTNYDGIVVILLGLILSFHFLILQIIGNLTIATDFLVFPFAFTLAEYHFMLVLFGYCFIIVIYLAFKISYRFRGYTTKTMSERAAFFKFLSLIDEEDRKRFLNQISKTVRDILVGGVMDLIEGQRSRWKDSFREGRKFLRRLFGREDDE
ncbi:MAG TPA: hypothetical protein VMV49_10295 [Candidatus Deferrimicrobium sp.]|nr:hypothetical protein [Candidatus Deferrimicrobium sp.]